MTLLFAMAASMTFGCSIDWPPVGVTGVRLRGQALSLRDALSALTMESVVWPHLGSVLREQMPQRSLASPTRSHRSQDDRQREYRLQNR